MTSKAKKASKRRASNDPATLQRAVAWYRSTEGATIRAACRKYHHSISFESLRKALLRKERRSA